MKVTFRHNNGREQVMSARFAKILCALGRGSYLAAPGGQEELAFAGTTDTRTIQQVADEIEAANAQLLLAEPPASPPRASKAALALAESAGVDIKQVSGTGDGGAITKPDVQAYIATQNTSQERAG